MTEEIDNIQKQLSNFTKTKEFQYLADYFIKYKCYTTYPRRTLQYKKFWDEVHDKCINGMTNSVGISITGQHFFYLNFVQILAKDSKDNKKRKLFPRFVDVDWEYFWYVDIAKRNQKSLSVVKGRRQGYSYKAAAIATHEFIFYRDSSSIIGAFLSTFSENTMNMVIDNCNFINKNTAFKKQRNPDTREFIQASYKTDISGITVWKGYNSKVRSITYKDNQFSAVGQSATWLILDEAGVFPNIIESYGMSEPLIKDGADYTGSALVFGSAGNMEAGSQNFKEIFMNPPKYNMLEFFDPSNSERRTGFFSSAAKGRWGKCRNKDSKWFKQEMVDSDGNSNIEAATDDIMHEREIKKKGGDNKAYHDFVTQYPLNYNEAFLTTHKSPFPIHLIQERLGELETTASITAGHWKGKLNQLEDGTIHYENSTKEPILEFPIRDKSSVNMEGCIEIYEQPYDDHPERGIYIAGLDPYAQDDAVNSDSLGSCIIMNRLTSRIVAQYTARPQTAKQFFETCRRLIIYYNAIANYENNLKGVFDYFEEKNCLYHLCDTPKILKDQQIVKTTYENGNSSKGSPANKEVNKWAREHIRTWLYEKAFNKEDGVTNTHVIPSVTILKELELWNLDGNFDRVSALGMLMILKRDMIKLEVEKEKKEETQDDYFKRNWDDKNSYMEQDFPQYYPNN